MFNRKLAEFLCHLDVESIVIQYVDYLIICSPNKEQCEKDSAAVLQTQAEGGHNVSIDKLQFCQQQVEYVSRQLGGGKKTFLHHKSKQ